MLNALRHHSYLHHDRGRYTFPGPSAQRLTASQLSTSLTAGLAQIESNPVLNALRHHSYLHPMPRYGKRDHSRVLNALRHHSYLHATFGSSSTKRYRAQRLTASQLSTSWAVLFDGKIDHRAQRLTASQLSTCCGWHCDLRRRQRCSTPYGITAIYIPYPRFLPCLLFCAQRLTASQLSTLNRLTLAPKTARAQRLTASQLSTCFCGRRIGHSFRGCSTPYGITAIYIRYCERNAAERKGVLNALRHHSYLHAN